MVECVKFLVVAAVILTPMFILANELDGDEFTKSGIGVIMGAVALGAFKMLESRWSKKEGP
jgi:hypothetical protein